MANLFRVNTVKLSDGSSINSGILYNANGVETVDFNNLILTGGNWIAQGISSVNTGILTGVFAALKTSNIFSGPSNTFNNQILLGNDLQFTNLGTSFILDFNGNASYGSANRTIYDLNQIPSLAGTSRILYDTSGDNVLNWQTQTLSGNWNVGTGTLSVQGSLVVTANQTGGFGGSTNTGQLTGVFYPLVSNPSNYITASQTGSFLTSNQTGVLTGTFYPLNSNPGSYITSSQTGTFASTFNLQNTGTTLQNEINSINNGTGNFITVGQIGVSNLNVTGFSLTGNINVTGISGITVITGNSSKLIIGINTGLFYSSSNPNNYVTSTQTGNLTGQFYPLNSNPSSYVTSNQTGNLLNNFNSFVYTTGTQTITGNKIFTNSLIFSGTTSATGENTYFSQKSNSEFVWGLNVNALNSDVMDSTGDSAFKFGMMTTNNNGGGYNGLHFQALPAANGSWSNAKTVWTVDVNGNNFTSGSMFIGGTGAYFSGSTNIANLFYSSTNPSGYITSSQTGAFASNINLQSTGSTLQTEINTLNNLTGKFITTGTLIIPLASISGAQPTGSYNIDWQKSDHFYVTLSGNTTFNFLNTKDSMSIVVATRDTGKGYSVTFPIGTGQTFSGIKWSYQIVPTQTSGFTDVYTFTQFNTGIYASYVQGF